MRVTAIQTEVDGSAPYAARVATVCEQVAACRDADLVLLPELWGPGGFSYREWAERAQPVDGPIGTAMSAAARDAGVMLHAGSIVERPTTGEVGTDGRGLWNTSLVYGPDGSLLTTYRKIHRFGFGAGEPTLMDPGEDIVLVDLPGGVGSAGLSTCYDLRFPELYRRQLDAGAIAFVVPAAWPAARVRHWTLLAHARAIENQCIVIACNTAGTHAGTEMGGHSQVIDAKGDALAMAGTGETVLSVDVDLAAVTAWREQFPVLRDRRL